MFAAGKGARSNKTAIAVVAFASTNNSGDSQVISIAKPTGSSAGHIMAAMVVMESQSASWNTAASWTRVYESTGEPAVLVAVRTLSAADAAISSFTFSSTVGTRRLGGTIVTLRNAAFHTAGAAVLGGSAPSVQADFSNSMLFTFAANSFQSISYAAPDSMSTVEANADGQRPSWAIYNQMVGAAATGVRTVSSVSGVNFSLNFLFKPV